MREINPKSLIHIRQAPVQSVRQLIMAQVVWRVEPFFLEFAPQGFCNIQVWRIGRQEEQIQSSFLPIWYSLLYGLRFVYACIIQNHKRFSLYVKRKFLHEFQNKRCVDVLLCHLPMALTLSVYQTKTVELIRFFREKTNLFIGKLPTVRDISFTANVSFIAIVKVYFALERQRFKFLQLFYLKFVMFGKRFALGTASYAFIPSASVFKKALKVVSHTFFPLSASHCALAVRIRCLLALMADRILALSSTCERRGFRPRPDCVCRPAMPSLLYRLTQLLTLMAHMPVMAPTSLEVRCSDFNNMLWQRMRKQWREPFLRAASNSWRCSAVRCGVLTRPIMGTKILNNLK